MHKPGDDVPPPSVQDEVPLHLGILCPNDGTLVTALGVRGEPTVSGVCPACKNTIFGRAELVHQTGSLVEPFEPTPVNPKEMHRG